MKIFNCLAVLLIGLISGFNAFAQDEILDVKPPQGFPFPWKWVIFALIAIILSILAWLWFNSPEQKTSPEIPVKLLPWEVALSKLNNLKERGLLTSGDFNLFYLEISDILRRYIEDRFNIDAPERTTEEFLIYMRELEILSGGQKNMLKNFLTACDKVKFAQHSPTIEDGEWAFGTAKSFVEGTIIEPKKEEFNNDI